MRQLQKEVKAIGFKREGEFEHEDEAAETPFTVIPSLFFGLIVIVSLAS